MAQALITAAGAGAKLKFYDGTNPGGLGAVGAGNHLLATAVFGSTIGTATAGTIDWDEAGATQTPSGFVAGTATFVDLTTSADAVVVRMDLGAGGWTVSAPIVNGVALTLSSLVWTMPGA
jgi:hypothetical protein